MISEFFNHYMFAYFILCLNIKKKSQKILFEQVYKSYFIVYKVNYTT